MLLHTNLWHYPMISNADDVTQKLDTLTRDTKTFLNNFVNF